MTKQTAAPERLLTEYDAERLRKIGKDRLPSALLEILEFYEPVARKDVPVDLVTLDSEVELRDVKAQTVQRIRLVDPGASDPHAGLVSIVSPIGAALLGFRAGDVVSWPLPDGGLREALIERVTYQPEADGPLAG